MNADAFLFEQNAAYVILFAVGMLSGILLANGFSFWKW